MRLHFLQRARDKLDDFDRLATLFTPGQKRGQGIDRQVFLEFGNDRLFTDESGATLAAQRCEGLILRQNLGGALEAIPADGAT